MAKNGQRRVVKEEKTSDKTDAKRGKWNMNQGKRSFPISMTT